MIPLKYKERYKRILQQDKITKEDVKQFTEAVKHFTTIYPEWDRIEFN